jgi:hypothetical protein
MTDFGEKIDGWDDSPCDELLAVMVDDSVSEDASTAAFSRHKAKSLVRFRRGFSGLVIATVVFDSVSLGSSKNSFFSSTQVIVSNRNVREL